MENFIAHNPTRLHFGKGCVSELGKAAKSLGKHALLVYGKGSVLKNGSYDEVKKQLLNAGLSITEFSGIKSNPLDTDVDAACQLGRSEGADLIVAVGGGSVIDSSKILALCMPGNFKAWDVVKRKVKPEKAVPLIAVLTLAATGTEMNPVAVIQNMETQEKLGYGHPLVYPAYSFLDPAYTLSVSEAYTAYGIADLTAHCLEAYFGQGDASLSDRFVFAIIQEAMEYGPALLNNPNNYDLRARIMWAATNALNGLTSFGRIGGDWGVHSIGHNLSFLYDMPHGASLTIVYPAWMKVLRPRMKERLEKLGQHLFGTASDQAAIDGIEAFFKEIKCPVRLSEEGIGTGKHKEILDLLNRNQAGGMNYILEDADREAILLAMA